MLSARHLAITAGALFLQTAFAFAQTAGTPIAGRVIAADGQPVAGATVSLVELNRAAISAADGAFRLGPTPAGRYTLSARRLGYQPATLHVIVSDGAPPTATITMYTDAQRIEPVNITALRTPADATSSPLSASVMLGDQLHHEAGVSLAHTISELPGVRNVSTGEQTGKPMIRGLSGPRVLVTADGSRIEDYSWSEEDGPSIDPRLADRVEVIRGPASILYGSDALAGVVNVVPADVPFADGGGRLSRGALELYGGTNNIELGVGGMLEGAKSNYGWRVTGTGRAAQNYQTPNGEVPNSKFGAAAVDAAFGFRGTRDNTVIRATHYGGEFHLLEATGPEPDDPGGGPVRKLLDDRLQVTNNHLFGGMRLETKAQLQRHDLAEVSDDCVPAPGQTTCQKVKDKQAFGLVSNTGTLDVLAHHGATDADGLSGTIGVSGMAQQSTSSGPIFIVPSATATSGAAMVLEQYTVGWLTVTGGLRGDARHLSSDAQAEISRAADSRDWKEGSGDAGVIVRPAPHLALVANYGVGWRAPTLFDLYANGPNLAEGVYEIGDPSFSAERSRNIDGAVRWQSDRLRAEVSAYHMDVDDFIYSALTSQTQNGLPVFRHAQTDARLIGGEALVEARVADRVTLRATHDRVQGDDQRADTPLPLIPPPRTTVGAAFDVGTLGGWPRLVLGGDVEMDARQKRLSAFDVASPGYTLVNFDAAVEHNLRRSPIRFDLRIRNAFNKSYIDYLSRFKSFATGPGFGAVLKASVGAW